jgi:hypothetical protein
MLDAGFDPFALQDAAYVPPGGQLPEPWAASGVSRAALAGPLENKGNYSVLAASDGWRENRRERLNEMKKGLRRALPGHNVNQCGVVVQRASQVAGRAVAEVWISAKSGNAYARNVRSCKNTHVCPHCASHDSENKRRALRAAVVDWEGKGGRVAMYTFTQSHGLHDSLQSLFDLMKPRLAAVLGGGGKQKAVLQAFGYRGAFVAWEVNWSPINGWHLHVHVLAYFIGGTDDFALKAFHKKTRADWIDRTKASGFDAAEINQNMKLSNIGADLGEYLAKHGIDWEMTHANTKRAKGKSRTFFQIVEDFAEFGRERDAQLIQEFEAVFKGKQKLTPLGVCRTEYSGSAMENIDDVDAIPGEVNDTADTEVCAIDYETWEAIARAGGAGDILEAARCSGVVGVRALLTAWGYDASAVHGPGVADRVKPKPKRPKQKEG